MLRRVVLSGRNGFSPTLLSFRFCGFPEGFSRYPKGPSTKQPGFMSNDTVPSTELAAGRESKTEVVADQACIRGREMK